MSLGDRLGLVGVILALFAIAAPYLWPDKKWIGWISLACAIALLVAWAWLELGAAVCRFDRSHQTFTSYVVVAAIGGVLSCGVWYAVGKLWTGSKSSESIAGSSAQINPIEPAITWPTPASITYGTQLSTDQLNARASVDEKEIQGFFAYSPGIGAILPTGSQMLIAIFTPLDTKRYVSVTKTVQLLVNPGVVRLAPQTSSPIMEAQTKELEAVGEFITRKDEMALRETFDLPNILAYNIKMVRRSLVPSQVSHSESQQIDDYFKGGQARLDMRFMNLKLVNNRIDAKFIPGKVGIINTSTKYIQKRAQLAQLLCFASLAITSDPGFERV